MSLIVDLSNGLVPPRTAEARKRTADRAAKNCGYEFDGPETVRSPSAATPPSL